MSIAKGGPDSTSELCVLLQCLAREQRKLMQIFQSLKVLRPASNGPVILAVFQTVPPKEPQLLDLAPLDFFDR